jgi:hypothetical protein
VFLIVPVSNLTDVVLLEFFPLYSLALVDELHQISVE